MPGDEGVGRRAEEMPEADLVERGCRRIGGDVAADARMLARAQHEGHRVPAQVRVERELHLHVAGERCLLAGGYRVDVGRRDGGRVVAAGRLVLFEQLVDQEMRAVAAFVREDAGHRVQPFLRFLRIPVDVVGGSVHDHFS